MTYTTSQNIKTRTTYMAATLFATLILVAGIAALAMHPAEKRSRNPSATKTTPVTQARGESFRSRLCLRCRTRYRFY